MRGKRVKALRRQFREQTGRAPVDAGFAVLQRFRLVAKKGDAKHVGTMQMLKPVTRSERRAIKRGP